LGHNQKLNLRLGLAGIDTLEEEKFSESNLPYLDLEDIIKVCLAFIVRVLLLEAHLSVLVELAREQQMVCWLNLDVVDGTQRVDVSCETIFIFDLSSLLFSESQHVDSILR
jgi:hypothetical protein